MLIDEFETGKVAEMDSKIIKEENSNYAKRVVSTPDRLNSPMRLNPFAWSNAQLPQSAPTSQAPSSVQSLSSQIKSPNSNFSTHVFFTHFRANENNK